MGDNTELHPAVQLILKRMESHPEEFTASSSTPMRRRISRYEDYLSEAEHAAILDALSALMKDAMHKEVLHQMLAPEESPADDTVKVTHATLTSVQTGMETGLVANTTTSATLASQTQANAWGQQNAAARTDTLYDAAQLPRAKRRSILSWGPFK